MHEGIADGLIGMIQAAAQHLQRLNSASKVLVAQEGRAQAASNLIANSVPPAAFEVGTLAEVKDEIFGPVLQIVRWGYPQPAVDGAEAVQALALRR